MREEGKEAKTVLLLREQFSRKADNERQREREIGRKEDKKGQSLDFPFPPQA